jgi:hypothetical protein
VQRGKLALFAFLALASSACATETGAPIEMPLRDVLRMTPDEVRALPLDQRLDLRARFEHTMDAEVGTARTTDDGSPTDVLAHAADLAREEVGDDVLLLTASSRHEGVLELETLPHAAPDAGVTLSLVADLSWDEDLDEYTEVIEGPARPFLERLGGATGVTLLAASPGLPGAALADEDAIRVSPTWLALLASLESADRRTTSASIIYGPLEHHSTTSSHFGCYSSCDCSFFGGDCRCNYCGFDWGLCASECGPDGEACHCRAGPRPRATGSFLDPLFVVLPLAYLALRRRRQ